MTALAETMASLLRPEMLLEVAATVGVTVHKAPHSEMLRGEAEIYSGPKALLAAAGDWAEVAKQSQAHSVFQTREIAEAAVSAHVGHHQVPYIVVVRERGQPVAILPLVMTSLARHRVLRFLGDPLIQYGDALLSSAGSIDHLETALVAARSIPADALFLRKVRDDACLVPILNKYGVQTKTEQACSVDLKHEYSLPPRDERELRRLRRRLGERGEINLKVSHGSDALTNVLLGLQLKRQWLNTRKASSPVIGDGRWERAIAELANDDVGFLATARLDVGGELAAIEIAMCRGNKWIAFLGAINPDFAKWGPGQIQMSETIAYAREKGFSRYDLLAPADAFKRVIANDEHPVNDYAIALSLRGTLLTRAFKWMPRIKKFLNAAPLPLRDAMQTFFRLR